MTDSAAPAPAENARRIRGLATDTIVYGVAAAVSRSFSLILFPFLTRSFSVEDYGRFDFALYCSVLLGLVIVWGQDSAVARLFFDDEREAVRRQLVSQALLAMFVTLAVSLGLAFLVLHFAGSPKKYFGDQASLIVLLLGLYAAMSAFVSFCQGLLKWTFQRGRYIAIALGLPALNLAAILSISQLGKLDPVTVLTVMSCVSLLFCLAAVVFIRPWLSIPQGIAQLRHLVPLALPYGTVACISAVSPLLERAVISQRFGLFDLGLYAAAAKIASLASMLAIAFQMGWGPFSYSIYKSPGAGQTYNLVLRYFTLMMCLAVLGISGLAQELTTLLAGGRYRGAALYVFPLAMAFGVQAVGWITEIGIHLSKRTYLNLVGFTLFLTSSMMGILYLSRVIGIIGVPIGALCGQLAMLVASGFLGQKACPLSWDYRLPATTLIVTLGTGAACLLASYRNPELQTGWIYAAGIVTILAMNLTFGLSQADRGRLSRLLRSVFGRARKA